MGSGYENETDSEGYENETDSEGQENETDSEDNVTLGSDEDLKTKIFSTLQQIKTPNAFAFGAIDWLLANPGLYLPAYGTLGLPLSTDDAQKIISQASQSPFGKGEETIVDTTVRKSWELNPDQFSLKNPEWNKAVETIVDSVTTGLGLGKGCGKISAELYKLLLYEPGAFFKPHKDSEKAPGMFATLVVCLPSPHEGGKLVLTHDNEKYEFETAGSSNFGGSYAAWYSDITHEVLPVVSGYRLVLTYNLIRQTDFVVPSHDLVRGRVKQLLTLLEEYNLRLETGNDKLPPILVHKLEHEYAQASLKLNALKPPDVAQVQVLGQLAARLGFDIHLASLELEVRKEDEYNDDTTYDERIRTLGNVVELDGRLVVEIVHCPDGALIDPEGEEEGQPYKEEHEGYSGNAGSPATFWYRDTVVALLPPSRQLDLVFNFKFDGSIMEPRFSKLMQEFSQDPAQKPKLEQLCKLALKQTPKKRNDYHRQQYAGDIPPYFRQAATTALDLGCVGLFDGANKTMCDKIMLGDARALGCSAAKSGVAAMTDRLTNCLLVVSSVAKKVEFLDAVAEGFETAEPQPSSAERVSLKQWSDEAILTAVAQLKTLTKDDGISLARLCKTTDWSLFESRAKPAILKAVMKTKISFINELMSTLQQELDEKQRSFVEMAIRSVWNEFAFEAKSDKPVPQVFSHSSWRQNKTNLDNNNNLNETDILRIVENTITILSPGSVETTIIPAILTAIPIAPKESTKDMFILLVQVIVKNKLAGFIMPTSDTIPPPSHKRLVQALLTRFISENVSPQPEAPKNWSVPVRSCVCSDCAMVNRFLQDPYRQSFDLQCVERRRKHLNQTFNIFRQSFYDITTVRGTSPLIWRITKHHRDYERARSDWEYKTKYATQPLSALKNDEAVGSRLKAYLEPYYDIIMSFNVKKLPDLKSLLTTPQLLENNENAASALNQPTNQTGLKRGAGDSDPQEDELAKRTKS